MKKHLLAISLLIFSVLVYMTAKNDPIQETITYFPIDPTVAFQTAATSLVVGNQLKANKYTVQWRTESTLDRKAYLRQDVSLLFSNGKLIGTLGKWVANTRRITQEKEVQGSESSLIQALTFHYAELHHNEAEIFSAQTMTNAQRYVIHSPSGQFFSYQTASSAEEKKWKQILDDKTASTLQTSWQKGLQAFSIPLNHYHAYPLTEFYFHHDRTLPGFSSEETARVIGNLWEGLYKNYFLGIKKADGTFVSPYGSTLPLILVAKDKTQLLVVTETAKGEPILLRQKIEYGRLSH